MDINLKYYRKEKRISQSEIADLIGISKYQYLTWEKNESVPFKYIDKLSDILGKDFSLMNMFTPESLKATRVLSDLTQSEVATFLGISQQNYDKWEQGTRTGFDKYEDKLLELFKKNLKGKNMIPMLRKKVPGAIIMSFLDDCYILINDNRIFKEDKYIFHFKMNIIKYNVDKVN